MKKKDSHQSKDLQTQAKELLTKLSTDTIAYSKKEYERTARSVAERSMSAGSSQQIHADKKGR